jgi:hypothetical protein
MTDNVSILVFSKDRPLQLHATLESFAKRCHDSHRCDVSVLFYPSEEYIDAYIELERLFPNVKFIREGKFYLDVFKFLRVRNKFVSFLVDDIIFKNDFSIMRAASLVSENRDVLCFSLRLGLGMDQCYSCGTVQNMPKFFFDELNGFLSWDYSGQQGDWGYPMSLDGNIFLLEDFSKIFSVVPPFHSPNSMEANLSRVSSFKSHMSCFYKSVLFNNPINRVQNEFQNRCESGDAKVLLQKWNDGLKIDIEKYRGLDNNSCHFPVELEFVKR